MTGTAPFKRLADPVLESSILITTLFFWLAFYIAIKAGMFGLWLLIVLVPAWIGYLVRIVEARALRRAPPLLGIEHFNMAHALWRMVAVLPIVLLWFLHDYVGPRSALAANAVLLIGILWLPLLLARLAITHAPLASLDPRGSARLLRRLGAGFLWPPAVLLAAVFCVRWLRQAGVAEGLLTVVVLYWQTAFCAVTGEVVAALDVRREIDIDAPLERSPEEYAAACEVQRQAALNHAYAFISRDNRAGGFAHLAEFVSRSEDPFASERWFLDGMFGWERPDAALAYAQLHLGHLLAARRDVEAMKLMARCLRVDARFRPLPADQGLALAVAERLGNDEVAARLTH
ncbi:MAG TPA: hypothetical protein VFE85_05445 [Woeseiaceae bacterium]|nr:hypothetical protein [Woeseiaceae bacterium]